MTVQQGAIAAAPDPSPAAANQAKLRARRQGMGLMLLGAILLTSSDAISKLLSAEYPLGELICLRGTFVLLPVLLVVPFRGGFAMLKMTDPRGQLLRALLFVSSSVLFVSSLGALPLPFVTALTFVSPIFMTVLAIPMLGERVAWQTWCAVILGFVGVVIIVDPTAASWHWAAILPVAGAFSGALRDILTRKISSKETSASMLFYSMGITVLATALTAPFGWRLPHGIDLLLFPAVGLLMGIAHYVMIEALRRCEVSLLAPLRYAMIVWSITLGFFVWGDLPTLQAMVGTVIIMASGLYVVRRQARAA